MTEIRGQFESVEDNLFSDDDNSQPTCFICTKSVSSLISHNPTSNSVYSVKTIFRHLKIYQEVKMSTNYEGLVDVVPFCESCYEIFTKLSSYCADLEILQMKIQYFFDQLNQLTVMEMKGQDSATAAGARLNNARKQMKSKLEKKCASSNLIGPAVLLPQLEIEQIRRISYQATDVDANSVYSSNDGYEPSDDEVVQISEHQFNSSDQEQEADTNGPPKNKPGQPKKFRRDGKVAEVACSSKKNKTFPCPECGSDFKIKDSLLEHLPLFHPETHFPKDTKPDNLTHSQYKMYLIHLLNTEVDSCGSSKTGFKCAYCPKIFKNKRRLAVRLHLIKEHQDNLLEKFVQLQKEISTEQLPNIVKMPGQSNQNLEKNYILKQFCKIKRRMKPEHTCSVCEVRTTSLRKHEAHHHPETFLFKNKLEQISSEQFKLYCAYLTHKLADTFSKSQVGLDKKIRYNCPHCPNSYTDLQGCRNHLVLGHVALLSVEIVKLQQTIKPNELNPIKPGKPKAKFYNKVTKEVVEVSTVKCEICDIRLTQRGITIHMRKNHPDEYLQTGYSEVCLICKERFRYKWWYNFHRTVCHPEIIFEKWRDEGTTVERFKKYCEYLIGNEIRDLWEVGAANGKVRYKCTYCTSTFCDTKYSRTHLVMGHEDILGNKLVELQKSKSIEEIEQGMVISKVEFEEEFGQDEDFEETEVFCEKSVTKVEVTDICGEKDDEMVDLSVDQDLNEISLENGDRVIKVEDGEMMDEEAILPD